MLDGYTMDVLEQRIGYCFHNKALLKQALTHSSYTNEQKINKTENYERIEFLGDAVLELVSSDFLFQGTPGYSGGRADQDARLHGVRAFPGILCQRPGAGTVYAFG